MSKTNLLTWLQEGRLPFPRIFITHYKEMNLDEYEVVLLLHILSYIEKGMNFPHHRTMHLL